MQIKRQTPRSLYFRLYKYEIESFKTHKNNNEQIHIFIVYTKIIYDYKKYNRNIMCALFYSIITLLYFLFFTHCIPFEMV